MLAKLRSKRILTAFSELYTMHDMNSFAWL